VLCPGQGAQHAGMLKIADADRAAAQVIDTATSALGADPRSWLGDSAASFENVHAQPLICVSQLAWWAALRGELPQPIAFAGYSVGELAAYGVADALDAATLARLARDRARLMDAAAGTDPGGVIALRGISRATAAQLCAGKAAFVAIVVDEDACVIGGTEPALAAVKEAAGRAGAQVTCLRVGIASHTPLLATAATEFNAILEAAPLRPPVRPVACGVDGSWVTTRERAVAALSMQISRTIEWSRCIDALHERGCRVFLELGPGTALSRMVRNRLGPVEARSVDEFRNAGAVAAWVQRSSDRVG